MKTLVSGKTRCQVVLHAIASGGKKQRQRAPAGHKEKKREQNSLRGRRNLRVKKKKEKTLGNFYDRHFEERSELS